MIEKKRWAMASLLTLVWVHSFHGTWSQTISSPSFPAVIRFNEFFSKISVEGLEFSPALKALDGKRVQITGYMVREAHPQSDRFFFAPQPIRLDPDCGGASLLPYDLVRVGVVHDNIDTTLPYTIRPLTITGVLSLGNREEKDGTVSLIRLTLDSGVIKKVARLQTDTGAPLKPTTKKRQRNTAR